MACTSPLKGYVSRQPNENGKHPLVFNAKDGGEFLDVPCGQCMACRLERSRQWAMRITHEASLHTDNCFLTLTYDDEHLPSDWSLNRLHFQKFIRSLRKRIAPTKVRYYHCGEYGDLNGRPHYHVALFGYDFDDKELIKDGEYPLFQSQFLSKSWPYGFCSIGSLTWDSASYVSSYITKKITGPRSEEHYKRFHPDIGVYWLAPEYSTMSLKPGIGMHWYEQFKDDCLKLDYITLNGIKCKVPQAYDRRLSREEPNTFEAVKQRRAKEREKITVDLEDRLWDKNFILTQKHNIAKGIL